MENRFLCAIPCYNMGGSVLQVARACRALVPRVLVIDDGSDDLDIATALREDDITVMRHPRNLGKGAALRTALEHAAERGCEFLIAIDADGQHDPRDILALRPLARPGRLVIGARDMSGPDVPGSSTFGRAFSDFWVETETGVPVEDSQSGFRIYPVGPTLKLDTRCDRYDFEVEILARVLWAGLEVRSVPISVHYPKRGERITHFHPWRDNVRFSLLHTRLVARRLLPWPHRQLKDAPPRPRPATCASGVTRFLRQRSTPGGLAAAAALGALIGTLQWHPGLAALAVLYCAWSLTLNIPLAIGVQLLILPASSFLSPFIAFLAAPLAATLAGIVTFKAASLYQRHQTLES